MAEFEIEKISADDFTPEDNVDKVTYEAFGIKYLFPWQRLVIANILEAAENADLETEHSGHQIVLLPTGAGKSLCFQVPALILKGSTLVIYPLLALMSDQQRRMEEGGIDCVVLKGGQSEEERNTAFKRISEGAKIIITNPEVLSSPELLQRLLEFNISHIAIDEAHCVSEWGDSFRPAYLELGKILKILKPPVITAFTATASPEVLERVSDVLFGGQAHIVRSECDRSNIHYFVKKTAAKKQAILQLVKTESLPMIIFCSSRNRTEEMSRLINMCFGNEKSRFYHAGLEREEKNEIEKWFFDKKDVVLCATCAYGMGVDKKDIKTVVHLDPPSTAEAYIQEAGRGGRDGSIANAILLWNYEDSIKTSSFTEGSRYRIIKNFAEKNQCRRQVLITALGGEDVVCSGCDVCNRKNGINAPRNVLINDENFVLEYIRKHDKYFTESSLSEKILPKLNKIAFGLVKINIWDNSAVMEIIRQLVLKNKIKRMKGLWREHLCIIEKNKNNPLIYTKGK